MSVQTENSNASVTVPWLKRQKGLKKITMLTAYDAGMAKLLDDAGIDVLLVGDSVANVVYGEDTTLSIGMEEMLRHTKAVSRAAKRAMVIGDMPFMSYQVSEAEAVKNAGRFLKESGAHAVKLEGGVDYAGVIRAIVRAGIPVCAHIGLMPQSIRNEGGYRTYGKNDDETKALMEAAKSVERAGAFMVVLECVEKNLAQEITQILTIPTIGIGSGVETDGQVLVVNDLLGLTLGKVPKFVKQEANLKEQILAAAKAFALRVESNKEG